MLHVREVFRTLQGEGSRAGSPAVFVRFTGCNLWSGLDDQRDRGRGSCAAWCDTDFATGVPVSPADLLAQVEGLAQGMAAPLVVLTGGEPTLQLGTKDGRKFVQLMRASDSGFTVAMETNGMRAVSLLIDHITVSPKPLRKDGAISSNLDHVVWHLGTDLKVVAPTPFSDADLLALARGFQHAYVQPMDVGGVMQLEAATQLAERLGWRVSVQVHKLLGLP